jgi:hypothetical protein
MALAFLTMLLLHLVECEVCYGKIASASLDFSNTPLSLLLP